MQIRMRILFLGLSFMLLSIFSVCAQNKSEVELLIKQGVEKHDKALYSEAIAFYDRALALEKNNVLATAEKAFSLFMLKDYETVVALCEECVRVNRGADLLYEVYNCYGNALDMLKRPEEALHVYDEGIQQFAYFQLYFNKGITLSKLGRSDEALSCFQDAIVLQPQHSSSHYAIAQLAGAENKRIQSIMAFARFLTLEPTGWRAREALGYLQRMMKGNVQKTSNKEINLSINAEALADSQSNPESFGMTELILDLSSAIEHDSKFSHLSDLEHFINKFEKICSSLAENYSKTHKSFFWTHYAPYFIEMKQKKQIKNFAYIIHASSKDTEAMKWLKKNDKKIRTFYDWHNNFKWSK